MAPQSQYKAQISKLAFEVLYRSNLQIQNLLVTGNPLFKQTKNPKMSYGNSIYKACREGGAFCILLPNYRKHYRNKSTSLTTCNSSIESRFYWTKKMGAGCGLKILYFPWLVTCSHDDLILCNLGVNKIATPKTNTTKSHQFRIISQPA